MAQILFGVFVLLHGLVHGLYFGHSRRFFELQPGLTWPDGSWAFSGLLGEAGTRNLANVVLIVIAVAMIAGGIGIAVRQEWARTLTVSAAVISIVLYAALWIMSAKISPRTIEDKSEEICSGVFVIVIIRNLSEGTVPVTLSLLFSKVQGHHRQPCR